MSYFKGLHYAKKPKGMTVNKASARINLLTAVPDILTNSDHYKDYSMEEKGDILSYEIGQAVKYC